MKNNKKGFTLVELVIVVAVMAILVAVAIPTVGSITGSARTSVNESNAQTIESMLKLAEAEGTKTSPDGKGSVSCETIATVIVDAKLGIEEGSFVYNYKTGNVKYDTKTTTTDDNTIIIAFAKGAAGKSATVTVSYGTAGADGDAGTSQSVTKNLDGTAYVAPQQ